jgi:hypothetical protein
MLQGISPTARRSAAELDRLKRVALSGGAAHLTKQERMAVISDRAALQWLHHEVWKDWPTGLLERVATTSQAQSRR